MEVDEEETKEGNVIGNIKAERSSAGDGWRPTRAQVERLAEYTAPKTYKALTDIPGLEWEDNTPKHGDWEVFNDAFGDTVGIDDEEASWFVEAYEDKIDEMTDDE